jgi:hypothetical protein
LTAAASYDFVMCSYSTVAARPAVSVIGCRSLQMVRER